MATLPSEPRPQVLQLGALPPFLSTPLNQAYEVTRLDDQRDAAAFLAQHGARFTGVATSAGVGITPAQLAALPSLQVISSMGVGLDKFDLPAIGARGVALGYTPDVLNDCVADTAFALLLAVARRAVPADRFVRAGRWAAGEAFPLGRQVSRAKLGIVGLGRIGQTIARRAAGFEMDIRYHSRRPVEGAAWPHEPSLMALARWCDYLVVITAGGAGTRHLVDAEVLTALGPRGFIVNVARGSVIDEAALVAALAEGRIAGAGLDVFEDEPRVPAALFAMDQVVLLPHIASATEETRLAMAQRVLDNLAAFYRDGRLVSAAA